MNNELIQKTYDVIDAMKESFSFQALLSLNEALESEALKPVFETYKKTKKVYLEAKQYSTFHPDLKTYQKAFQTAKNDLYTHPTMKAYLISYRAFQNELDEFVSKLGQVISPKIKISMIPPIK